MVRRASGRGGQGRGLRGGEAPGYGGVPVRRGVRLCSEAGVHFAPSSARGLQPALRSGEDALGSQREVGTENTLPVDDFVAYRILGGDRVLRSGGAVLLRGRRVARGRDDCMASCLDSGRSS